MDALTELTGKADNFLKLGRGYLAIRIKQLDESRRNPFDRHLIAPGHAGREFRFSDAALEVVLAQLDQHLAEIVGNEARALGQRRRSDFGNLPARQITMKTIQKGRV